MINVYIGQTRIIQNFFLPQQIFSWNYLDLPQLSTRLCQEKHSQCSMQETGSTPSLQVALQHPHPVQLSTGASALTGMPFGEQIQVLSNESLRNPQTPKCCSQMAKYNRQRGRTIETGKKMYPVPCPVQESIAKPKPMRAQSN